LFFSWLDKNRQFKQGSAISGQIAPFLILIMVILLIAAVATINIGRVALDKTTSSNAADAGALAAASYLCRTLNLLAKLNYDLQDLFDEGKTTILGFADEVDGLVQDAVDGVLFGQVELLVFIAALVKAEPGGCHDPVSTAVVLGLGYAAADTLNQAAEDMAAFYQAMLYIQSYYEALHVATGEMFCSITEAVSGSYDEASIAGLQYAFSNSGIMGKLSTAQAEDFNTQFKIISEVAAEGGGINSFTYGWPDALGQQHSVTASLNLPAMPMFKVMHTANSYFQEAQDLNGILLNAQLAASLASMAAGAVESLEGVVVAIEVLIILSIIFSKIPFLAAFAPALCVLANELWGVALSVLSMISTLLGDTCGIVGSWIIHDEDNKLDTFLDGLKGPDYPTSDVIGCEGGGAGIQIYTIVKIEGFALDDNTITCTVEQQHPGTDTGILTTSYPLTRARGTAEFAGGDVSNFNCIELIDEDGNIFYEEGGPCDYDTQLVGAE
jgi:hypothetical protein